MSHDGAPDEPQIPGTWPSAHLDRITRLQVLAAGLPGTVVRETWLDAPFDATWSILTDFERSVPAFDEDVARLRIVRRTGQPGQGEKLRFVTRQTARVLWIPAVVDVDLSPGWCWMVSRPQAYVVGMAAEPHGDGTRLAHLEGLAFTGPGWFRFLTRPLLTASSWRHRRHIPHDLGGMERLVHDRLHGDPTAG